MIKHPAQIYAMYRPVDMLFEMPKNVVERLLPICTETLII